MEARLVLEDGSQFKGFSKGARGEMWGEVVFNTSMTGYQEILTDPSYCGQILVMTFPLIGNYGINNEDFESRRPFLRGLVARELCTTPNNWRQVMSIGAYLKENNIVALDGIDTRALARHLREKGTMRGILTTENTPLPLLLERAGKATAVTDAVFTPEVTIQEPYTWENGGPHIIIVDLGLKLSIARSFHNTGCRVTVVPAFYSAGNIMDLRPAGIVFSNGPGNPAKISGAIQTAGELIGSVPMMGICLGHQIIALALGAKAFKLKFGHRGANHPVKDLIRNKVYISTQNHGYAIDENSLPAGLQVIQRNLNDGTVEALIEPHKNIIAVQYHPEACSGPEDSGHLFHRYLREIGL